ncbi:MAG: hypothetical protein NT030_02800 [Candidatus Saganbacteria bacterium]|nr:hypothetical protein [Candidatus Saganbacteria bacterium]
MKKSLLCFLILLFGYSSVSFADTFVGGGINFDDYSGGDYTMSTMLYFGEAIVDITDSLGWFGRLGIINYSLKEAKGYVNGYLYSYKVGSPLYLSSGLKYRLLSEGKFPVSIDVMGEGNIVKPDWSLYLEETGQKLKTLEELTSLILRMKFSRKAGYGRIFLDLGIGRETSIVSYSFSRSSGISEAKIGVEAETPDSVLLYSFVERKTGLMSWFTGRENTSTAFSWTIGILGKF